MYLFERQVDRRRQGEVCLICWFIPKWLQQPGVGPAEARSRNCCQSSPSVARAWMLESSSAYREFRKKLYWTVEYPEFQQPPQMASRVVDYPALQQYRPQPYFFIL